MTARRTFVFLIALGIGAVVLLSRPAEEPLSSAPPKIDAIPGTTPVAQQDTSPVPLESAVNETEQLESFVCDPKVPSLDEITESRVEVDEDEVRKKLIASDQPQYLLAAAMLSPGSKDHPEILQKAFDANPNDPLTNWEVYLQCEKYSVHKLCTQRDWLDRITKIDQNNAIAWANFAVKRYQQGQKQEALKALRSAGYATYATTYVSERLRIVHDALGAATNKNFRQRTTVTFGFVAAKVDSSGQLSVTCRREASKSAAWAEACLKYGQISSTSTTMLNKNIGYAIQKIAYEAMEEYESAGIALGKIDQMQKYFRTVNVLNERFLDDHPSVHEEFIENWMNLGEVNALSQLDRYIQALPLELLKKYCR